jgi:HlyD family type I secretion membrane fusion protein
VTDSHRAGAAEADLLVGAERAERELQRWRRIGFAILAASFGVTAVWSATAPLSSAVVAIGTIKVDSNRKAIQHPEGGVVQAILVRDGSRVAEGEVLLRLDATSAGAAHGVVAGNRDTMVATLARLLAERDDSSAVEFPAELQQRAADPQVDEILRAQQSLFEARRTSLRGELSILDRHIASLREEIAGFRSQQRAKQAQIESLERDLESLRSLEARGLVEKPRLRAIERNISELTGEREELVSREAAARTAISERELAKFQAQKAFREKVVDELQRVQAAVGELGEREGATRRALELTELRAPVAGTVTGLRAFTTGGVIGRGETVMEIVPESDRLVVEARVAPRDIDRVRLEQAAVVKLHAFDSRSTPELGGQVRYVSADAVVDPRTDATWFVVKVEVTEEELQRLGDRRVQPGMQADVFIRTGERTLFGYLLQPLSESFNRAWRER